MAVVAIGGDDAVTLFHRRHDADDDRFLADVEVAEAADQPHAVHLARLLLEAADQQHVAIELFQLGRSRKWVSNFDRLEFSFGHGHARILP